mgnify:CR=1 FL=1
MTQREFVLKMKPDAERKISFGGVWGCPRIYEDILPIPLEMCNGTSTARPELCEKCWNQEMVLPAPAKKPMAQVNAFMNQNADEKPAENFVDHPTHYCQGSSDSGIGVADSQVHLAASVQGKTGGRPQESTVLP